MEIKKHDIYNFSKWDYCKTFKDLLRENIKFIKGIYKTSPYHCSPIYDMNNKKLLYLHKNRFLTTNGQSSDCKYNTYIPKTKHIYYINNKIDSEYIFKEHYNSYEQKSYITGYIENTILNNLITYLDFLVKEYKMPIKYQFYDFDNNKLYTNFTKNNYKVTRNSITKKSNRKYWKKDLSTRIYKFDTNNKYYSESFGLKHVFKIKNNINNIIFFEIFINKYCYKISIEDILVDFIKYNKLFNKY